MIVKITKITEEILNSPEGSCFRGYSYNLPLFDTNLDLYYHETLSDYVLQLYIVIPMGKDRMRYPALHYRINIDEMNKINAYWDYAIKNNKDSIEFEL